MVFQAEEQACVHQERIELEGQVPNMEGGWRAFLHGTRGLPE